MKTKTKKLISLTLSLLMAITILAGCSQTTDQQEQPKTDQPESQQPAEEPKAEQILKFGGTGWGGIFNPIMTDNVYDGYVTYLVFEKLVDNDSEGEFVPALAEWTISDDHMIYTFTLKDGIKFSDGSPLTTEDVEFTFKTIAHPDYDGPRAYAVSTLAGYKEYHSGETNVFEGIKVIDDKTISFTFAEGEAAPANIQCFNYGIMPSDYYAFNTWEDFLALNEKPMGSGVCVFDSWEPKQYIKLMKNTNYWDPSKALQFDGVLMSEVPDESILSALQTGQIDFAQISSSAENLKAAKAMDNIHLFNYLGNGYTFMCFNCIRPQLEDVRVRQALMYALDRKSFINAEYGEGLAEVGMAPISPASWAFPDSSKLNAYDFDMDKAAKLMDEAGWKMESDGFRYKDGQKFHVNWLVYTDSTWPGTLSGMAADTWKQLGVELEIELMDFDTVSSRTMEAEVGEKDFDIFTMGFSLDPDPDPTGALFDDDAYVKGGFNASGYKNPEAMELVKQGKAEFDTEKRAVIYKEWAKIMNDQIPHVIIAYRNELFGINNRVKNMTIDTYVMFPQSIRDVTLE